jgi:hypothetical protein
MHTPSIRILAALAYERGEEFDPGAALTPALVEQLSIAASARPILPDSAPFDCGRRPTGRAVPRQVPEWFSPCDLVDPPIAGTGFAVVHGEPV